MTKFNRLLALILGATLALGAGHVSADSWKSGKGKSKGKHKTEERYEAGDCEYKIKANRKGHGKKIKCRGNAHFSSGPPPWAPAHGYRAKGEARGRTRAPYVPPFDLAIGRCDRAALGAVLGGATGAAIGSQIGSGDGRTAAILGGTILGILVGGSVGLTMDQVDQNCVGQALEHAPDGQAIIWDDARSNAQYQVAPIQTIQSSDGQYCREYTATANVGGRTRQTFGLACRQPDGSWRIRS